MDIPARRLVNYYQSPQAIDDLLRMAARDPSLAAERRAEIARHLNENFAFAGAIPSELDIAAQSRFIEGSLPAEEVSAHIQLYARSISARWGAAV